jgi:hypothetical protein
VSDHLKVFAGLVVGDECPLRYFRSHDGEIVFVCGGDHAGDVELAFSPASLATFVRLGEEALAAG